MATGFSPFHAGSSRTRSLLLSFSVAAGLLCSGCDDDDKDDATDTGSSPTDTDATGAGSGGEAGSGGGMADTGASSDTGASMACGDATDEASCATATNPEDDGSCTWLAFMNLSIDDAGACGFTDAGVGTCVGRDGLDDGCDSSTVCDDSRSVYYRAMGNDWQLAQGAACRGAAGFDLCEDTSDAPCSCACDLP